VAAIPSGRQTAIHKANLGGVKLECRSYHAQSVSPQFSLKAQSVYEKSYWARRWSMSSIRAIGEEHFAKCFETLALLARAMLLDGPRERAFDAPASRQDLEPF
jgi:hypothetical protein